MSPVTLVLTGMGFARNPFGVDFAAAGFHWTAELCAKDSDGDGLSNGEELGDPACVWQPGFEPSTSINISHPGFSDAQLEAMARAVRVLGDSSPQELSQRLHPMRTRALPITTADRPSRVRISS